MPCRNRSTYFIGRWTGSPRRLDHHNRHHQSGGLEATSDRLPSNVGRHTKGKRTLPVTSPCRIHERKYSNQVHPQQVFDLGSLRPHASFFQNSPPGQLLQVLSDEFAASTGYAGKDHLQVVVTDGSTCSMPLPAVYLGLSKPLAKRPEPNRRESHASILVRERMKAAYTHVVNYNWRMQSCEELG